MKKFELGRNASIVMLVDNYPEETLYFDNSPVQTLGRGVGLKIIIEEANKENEPIEIVMDKKQTKSIIKGLKMQIRRLKK